MIRAIALAAAALVFTATTAQARVTYGMNGNGTYTGQGTADCKDGTEASFTCDDIAGLNPFTSGDFQSSPDSTGMGCAASACANHGGVVLMSVRFEITDGWWNETVDGERVEWREERHVDQDLIRR